MLCVYAIRHVPIYVHVIIYSRTMNAENLENFAKKCIRLEWNAKAMVKQAAVKSIDSVMSVHRPPSKSIHWKVFVRNEFSLVAHTHTHAACTHATCHTLIYFTRHNRVSIRVRFRQAIFVSFLLSFLNFIAIVLNLWKMCNAELDLSSNVFFFPSYFFPSSSASPCAGLFFFFSFSF